MRKESDEKETKSIAAEAIPVTPSTMAPITPVAEKIKEVETIEEEKVEKVEEEKESSGKDGEASDAESLQGGVEKEAEVEKTPEGQALAAEKATRKRPSTQLTSIRNLLSHPQKLYVVKKQLLRWTLKVKSQQQKMPKWILTVN